MKEVIKEAINIKEVRDQKGKRPILRTKDRERSTVSKRSDEGGE